MCILHESYLILTLALSIHVRHAVSLAGTSSCTSRDPPIVRDFNCRGCLIEFVSDCYSVFERCSERIEVSLSLEHSSFLEFIFCQYNLIACSKKLWF